MLRSNRYLNASMTSMHSGLAPTQNGLMGFGWASVRSDGWGKLVSVPSGYPAPTNGLYPAITGGAMSSYKKGTITLTGTATGAMGLCRTASGQVILDGSATGGLVAGGVASGAATFTGSAEIAGVAAGSAEGTAVFTGSADIAAIGHAAAQGDAVFDGEVEAYGLGFMVATTEVTSELTPESIAAAVWAKILGGAISAEDTLLAAGSAGDPWSTPLPGSYTGTQAGKIIDELRKLAGLDATAPVTHTPDSITAGDIDLALTGDGIVERTVTRTS